MDIHDTIRYLHIAMLMHRAQSIYYECPGCTSGDSIYDAGGASLHKNISDSIEAVLQIIEEQE